MNRSSFTCKPRECPDERALTMRILEIAAVWIRYGYKRITALLKREG